MTETTAIERRPKAEAPVLSSEMQTLIRDTWFKGATEIEFKLAIAVCEALKLNPLKKQIHFVKIWDGDLRRHVMQPVTSIQGFRSLAEATGQYRGTTEREWCGPDGEWTKVWLSNEPPVAARVGVRREGFPEPEYGFARFESYCRRNKDGGLTATWRKMPEVMIAKCAEAQAFRQGFPAQLAGIYSEDEMDHMRPFVEGGPLVETNAAKQLPENGTVKIGFAERREETKERSEKNLKQLLEAIEAAETDEDLDNCTVNGELESADRAYAKSRWQAKRELIHKQQRQQQKTDTKQKDEAPNKPAVNDRLDEQVKTPVEAEPDPWIKHMDETREKFAKGGQQEIEKHKEADGKKTPNGKH